MGPRRLSFPHFTVSPRNTPGKSLRNSFGTALFTRRNGISPELLVPQIPHLSVVDRLVLQPQASQVHREGAASASSSPSPSMVCLVALLLGSFWIACTRSITQQLWQEAAARGFRTVAALGCVSLEGKSLKILKRRKCTRM